MVKDEFSSRLLRLADHALWADRQLLEALTKRRDGEQHTAESESAIAEALREEAHVIGSLETWLSRLEGRRPRLDVWPSVDLSTLERLVVRTHADLRGYFESPASADLGASITYVNSAGNSFSNTVGDILTHAFLHAQYHRGKVNLLLRKANLQPAPVDFIAFVRGTPAATEADAAAPRAES